MSKPLEIQFDSNIFRMRTKDGITPRKAIRFPVLDQYNHVAALAGIGYTPSDASTSNSTQKLCNTAFLLEQLQCFENQLCDILNKELKLLSRRDEPKNLESNKTYFINGEEVILTRRELQCLSETVKGYSAKMVGDKLFM